MSDLVDKEKKEKRIGGNLRAMNKQVRIARSHGIEVKENDAHRYVKHHALDCGNPRCILCASPRKTRKERTIQERRAMQREND